MKWINQNEFRVDVKTRDNYYTCIYLIFNYGMDYNYNYNYYYNYAYEARQEKTDPQATADDPFDPLLRRFYLVHTTCCLFCRHHDVLWGSSDYAPTGPASRCVMAHRVALLPPTGTTGKSSLVRQSPKRHLITVHDRCFGA